MSMSSRSLFLLKTRDLSVQDHSMNIEVMLAPNRTYLLMNKHKTLNAKSNKQKDKVERQRDSSTHSYVSEKRLVDRRNQEFYIKRVNMFLNQLTPNTRSTVLDRKSFSPSLNKIQDDNKQASEAVKVVKTKVKPRVKSEPCTPRGSISSSFPLIPTDRRQSKSSVGFHERAKDKDVVKQTRTLGRSNVAVNGAYLTIQGSRFQNETRTKEQSSGSPVPEYFPPVSPTHNITRDVVTPTNRNPSPQTLTATGDKKPTIPFLSKKKVKFVSSNETNGYKNWEETQNKEKQKTKYLDKKIEGFMLDQLRFNQANRISHYDAQRRNVNNVEDIKPTAKSNLVDMFDAFCQTGTKQQMHKLVKMAAKMKVKTNNPTSSTSMAPSIASFKNSQAFKRLNEVLVRS